MPHSIGKSSQIAIQQFHLHASNNMRKRTNTHAYANTNQFKSNTRRIVGLQSIEYLLQTLIHIIFVEFVPVAVAFLSLSLHLSNYSTLGHSARPNTLITSRGIFAICFFPSSFDFSWPQQKKSEN